MYICQSQSPNSSHPPFSPLVSIHSFSTSVSLFLLCKWDRLYQWFHIYALIYDIGFSLSDLLHSVWQSLGPSTSLQMTQFRSALRPSRASLVAQCLRIRLPMQGTQVRTLVQEDPTCLRATKPVRHNYWACAPQLLKPTHLEPVLCNNRSHCNEKPAHCNEE